MPYNIDERNLDRQRLLGKVLEPGTRAALDRVGIPPRGRCLDVGCGLGETTQLIASYLGPEGVCVGLERDAALVAAAKAAAVGLPVEFHEGDATRLPFEDGTFDFAFTRYLLLHVPDPSVVLLEMFRVVKPGGAVLAVEPDFEFQCSDPPTRAYQRMSKMFGAAFEDAQLGRRLVRLLRDAGGKSIRAQAAICFDNDGSGLKTLYRMTMESIGPALIAKGTLTAAEHTELLAEFVQIERDDHSICFGNAAVAAWGRVP
jgi:ubiquinone/menaquinone biosynthesis C-methylase UbiE